MTTTARPSITLSPKVRAFLAEPHYASLASVDPDGGPRQAVIWYLLEGDELVINSRIGRRWPTNLLRDPRVSMAVLDRNDGLRWVGLTGHAQPVHDQPQSQADIAAMARRYRDDEEDVAGSIATFESQQRISFRIRVDAVHEHIG